MAEPLSPEDLEAIRAREQAATPGPWTPSSRYPHICWQGEEDEPHILSANLSERPAEDIAFAAHARDDVRRLLADVDRLKAENATLRRLHVGAENSINAALDLAARFDPTCGHTRVRAFIADLLRTLTTTPQKAVGE